MPPNYQFENVVCYIYLLTLLTHVGVYANSVAVGQTCLHLHCLTKLDFWLLKYFSKQQKQTILLRLALKVLVSDPETHKL